MNSRQFVTIIIITFVVGMAWLIFDIIFNTKASIPLSPKLQSALEPVNPNFSSRVLDLINREVLEAAPAPSPTLTSSPQPNSSTSSGIIR